MIGGPRLCEPLEPIENPFGPKVYLCVRNERY
jgi:hypothetical protein